MPQPTPGIEETNLIIAAHKVNTLDGLRALDPRMGVEIDVRCMGENLILNHEPHQPGDSLEDFLKEYRHKFIIFNIKEAGIEQEVIGLARKHGIPEANYFLLDVEYPFVYRATRSLGFKSIAVRYSEAEPIEFALAHKGLVDWVWIDTNSRLPLDKDTISKLSGFRTALVCPERWGRPQDISPYIEQMKSLGFKPDLVMTAVRYAGQWQQF